MGKGVVQLNNVEVLGCDLRLLEGIDYTELNVQAVVAITDSKKSMCISMQKMSSSVGMWLDNLVHGYLVHGYGYR